MKPQNIYTAQTTTEDCGFAALAMILKYYRLPFSAKQLQNYSQATSSATSVTRIQKAADHFGLTTQLVKDPDILFNQKNLVYPFVVHVVKGEDLNHYYVVLKVKAKYLVIADPDPDVGIIHLSYERFRREWTGIALFLVPQMKSGVTIDQYLKIQLSSHKVLLSLIIIATLFELAISVGSILFIENLIDKYLPNKMLQTITLLLSILLIAYLFQALFFYFRNWFGTILEHQVSLYVTLNVIKQKLNNSKILNKKESPLQVVELLHSLNTNWISNTSNLIFKACVIIILGIILGWQNWLLVGCILLLVFCVYFISRLQQHSTKLQSTKQWQIKFMSDLYNLETIQALGVEKGCYQQLDRNLITDFKQRLSNQHHSLFAQTSFVLVYLIIGLLVMGLGSSLVMRQFITLGQFIAILILLGYVINWSWQLISFQPQRQQFKQAKQQINSWIVSKKHAIAKQLLTIDQLQGPLTLKEVDFQYFESSELLRKINWTIKPQEKVVLLGRSGSGKSTLGRLLAGLEVPGAGQVLINQLSLAEIPASLRHSQIAYLPQSAHIITGTILDNLTLGNDSDVTMEAIQNVCAQTQIADVIEKLPQKYETKLTEQCAILTPGQQQQLFIARTLLLPARILILDEVFNAIDAIAQAQIINYLLKDKRSVIFITQSLNLARKINNIVFLENGQLTAPSTHRTLLAQSSTYSQLFKASRGRKNG